MRLKLLSYKRGVSKKGNSWRQIQLMGISEQGSEIKPFWLTEEVADELERQGMERGIHDVCVTLGFDSRLNAEIVGIEKIGNANEELNVFSEEE